jgi:V/A-type H+-transporting ATPase subunit A
LIREGVLQQSAVDAVDSFCSPEKQMRLLSLMLDVYHKGLILIEAGVPVQQLSDLALLTQAKRVKSEFSNAELEKFDEFEQEIKAAFDKIRLEYG